MSDTGKPEEQDIPFEDAPKRGGDAEGAKADESGKGAKAEKGGKDGKGGKNPWAEVTDPVADTPGDREATDRAEASTDRTPPGPGSTGPTSVREDLGTLAEEARKLWATIEARVVAPAVESYPEVARHLGAAGREVAKAFRSAVRGSEQNWRDGGSAGRPSDGARQQEKITVERVDRIDPPEQKNRD